MLHYVNIPILPFKPQALVSFCALVHYTCMNVLYETSDCDSNGKNSTPLLFYHVCLFRIPR